MKKTILLVCLLLSQSFFGFAQDKFVIQNKKHSDKIKFKLIHNLIVIPLEVNGVTLSFLLDTGVSKPIIFNFLNVSNTLKLKDPETIYLRGLGGDKSVEALKSGNNILKLGDAIKLEQDLYAVYNSNLSLAPRLGFPVHGIIGYDLFKDLIVQINYSNQTIILTEPAFFKKKPCKSCEYFDLKFHKRKPYIQANVSLNQKNIPLKLLIDSGGSDSLWLFENDSIGLSPEGNMFHDFLGHGLTGSVYGHRSKVKSFSLKSFEFKNVNVAFPDSEFTVFAQRIKDRNGSIAGNILKRFNMTFDYQKGQLRMKKNKYYNEKFSYNKSGIELAHDGMRAVKEVDVESGADKLSFQKKNQSKNVFSVKSTERYKIQLKPAYVIAEIRDNSPASEAGLMVDDLILSINGKDTKQYSLQEILEMFYEDNGRRIKLKIERDGNIMYFTFFLKAVL
ncbi:PDZ domain-containing protein [Algibacter mikhailovii]|uniref:PDZ domain-containing protein n=1 Tax=Algibacter mikhailovii TaxID=425498 RepID=UPI0024943E02|nr:PDZ domain-containing protein [Algibacter mikhailovii]